MIPKWFQKMIDGGSSYPTLYGCNCSIEFKISLNTGRRNVCWCRNSKRCAKPADLFLWIKRGNFRPKESHSPKNKNEPEKDTPIDLRSGTQSLATFFWAIEPQRRPPKMSSKKSPKRSPSSHSAPLSQANRKTQYRCEHSTTSFVPRYWQATSPIQRYIIWRIPPTPSSHIWHSAPSLV